LVSFKAKNKVVTRNVNNAKGDHKNRMQLTPRGQLHKETVYGKIKRPLNKPIETVQKAFFA
jgi:CRISPR-associated endonuclease Csn1